MAWMVNAWQGFMYLHAKPLSSFCLETGSGFGNGLKQPFTGPETLIRYQFDNHLGFACLELNEDAAIVLSRCCWKSGTIQSYVSCH